MGGNLNEFNVAIWHWNWQLEVIQETSNGEKGVGKPL
jgi:hypothetical protein